MERKSSLLFFSFFTLIFSVFNIVHANKPDVTVPTKPPIAIGMSVDLSTPGKFSRQTVAQGIEAYFDKVNDTGGIGGRELALITLDDAYEPMHAGLNVRELADKDKALAVTMIQTGAVPILLPIIHKSNNLLYAARTGTDLLRKTPPDHDVINFRASHAEELMVAIKALLAAGIKPNEFAFFSQNDAFGDAVYHGAMNALKATGYSHPELLPSGRVSLNSLNIEGGLAQILLEAKNPPKIIILGGATLSNTQFVKLAVKELPNTLFLVVSSYIFTDQVANVADNKIISTQVVPDFDSDLPAAREFREDFKKYMPNVTPNYYSFEGYLEAKLLVLAIEGAAAKNNVTTEGIIDAFENMRNVDIGIGVEISLDKMHHQALHNVWLTILKNGAFKPINSNELHSLIQK